MLAMGAEQLAWPFFSLYVLELGGSISSIALISSIGSVASVLVAPIGGYIADSRGRVKLLGLGTLAYSLCSIFFILAQNWVALAISIFIQMLTRIYMPALDAILADSTSASRTGRDYALSDTIAIMPSIISPLIIGFLANQFSVKFAVKMGFAGLLVIGSISALIRLSLKETVVKEKTDLSIKEIPKFIYDSYAQIILFLKNSERNLKILIIISMLMAFLNAISGPYWIVYAKQIIGITTTEWGIILSVGALLRLIVLIPAGFLVDKIGYKKVILISLIPIPICSLFFINSKSYPSVLMTIFIINLCNILISPASSALFAKSTSKSSRGSAVASIGRGRIGIVMGTGVLGGAMLLLPAKLIGYQIGTLLYLDNPLYPWILLSIGIVLIFIIISIFLKDK